MTSEGVLHHGHCYEAKLLIYYKFRIMHGTLFSHKMYEKWSRLYGILDCMPTHTVLEVKEVMR